MNKLSAWQKPIAWTLIALALPFVCAWQACRACRQRIRIGTAYMKEVANG
jgi:hypothetical protein